MKRSFVTCCFVYLTLVLCACEASHDYADGRSVANGYVFNENIGSTQLAADANDIITAKCLNCHGSSSNAPLVFEDLVNDGYIVKGPPEDSVLYRCLNEPNCITRDGGTIYNMAENANLTADELNTLNTFIDEVFIDPEDQ